MFIKIFHDASIIIIHYIKSNNNDLVSYIKRCPNFIYFIYYLLVKNYNFVVDFYCFNNSELVG